MTTDCPYKGAVGVITNTTFGVPAVPNHRISQVVDINACRRRVSNGGTPPIAKPVAERTVSSSGQPLASDPAKQSG